MVYGNFFSRKIAIYIFCDIRAVVTGQLTGVAVTYQGTIGSYAKCYGPSIIIEQLL